MGYGEGDGQGGDLLGRRDAVEGFFVGEASVGALLWRHSRLIRLSLRVLLSLLPLSLGRPPWTSVEYAVKPLKLQGLWRVGPTMGSQPCKSEGAIRTVDGRAHHADAIRRGNAPPLHTRAVGVGGEYASHANTWGAMGGSGVCSYLF